MCRYEYKIVTFGSKGVFGGNVDITSIESQLNTLGELGWEIISGFTTNEGSGRTKSIVYTLKREQGKSLY